jgi:UDP-glucose 4-epimerase
VTGGAGYIGSHTCVELINEGHEVVILDNLYNASSKVVDRIETITGKRPMFYETDLLDRERVAELFDKEKIDAVIHFAGLKAVGESVQKPIEYYHNNLTGTLILCDEMHKHGVPTSSSAPLLRFTVLTTLFRTENRAKRASAQIPTVDEMDDRADSDRYSHCR